MQSLKSKSSLETKIPEEYLAYIFYPMRGAVEKLGEWSRRVVRASSSLIPNSRHELGWDKKSITNKCSLPWPYLVIVE